MTVQVPAKQIGLPGLVLNFPGTLPDGCHMVFARNALGIEICQNGLRMVHVSGKPHRPSLMTHQEVQFPPGTLRLSLKEENVLAPPQFIAKVQEAHLKLLAGHSRVSVSLPDAAGHVLLLDLETRFKGKQEGIDIIRWKLKKSFPVDINETHIDYQPLQERENGELSLLVSLISRRVVTQYENLLAEAGLQPNRIDFTTFNLFRYFSSRLENIDNALLVVNYAGTLSVMIFNNGILDFYRSKEVVNSSDDTHRLYREISSSLLFYADTRPGWTLGEVFFISEQNAAEIMRGILTEVTEQTPVLLDASRVLIQPGNLSPGSSTILNLAAAVGAATRNL